MAEFSQTVRHELKENLQNKNLRAVVLTGSGRAFSAGGDIDWLIDRHNKSQVGTSGPFYQPRSGMVIRKVELGLLDI